MVAVNKEIEEINKKLPPSSLMDNDHFMITFSKSTSKNFNRALYIAEQADHFFVSDDGHGQDVFQAIYKPSNYLNFITLYELIGNWKSTFIFKDGEMIDRRVLGQINYCYGDKLRSHNESFCYGASMFTENPFGCHRLMIHSGQKPWHEWKKGEDNRYIYIDKGAMRNQIEAKAKTFKVCPAFDYDKIISTLNDLPNKIDKSSSFYKDLHTRFPDGKMTINVNVAQAEPKPNATIRKSQSALKDPAKSVGCASLLMLIPITGLALYLIT